MHGRKNLNQTSYRQNVLRQRSSSLNQSGLAIVIGYAAKRIIITEWCNVKNASGGDSLGRLMKRQTAHQGGSKSLTLHSDLTYMDRLCGGTQILELCQKQLFNRQTFAHVRSRLFAHIQTYIM